jgi:hypothetical protein
MRQQQELLLALYFCNYLIDGDRLVPFATLLQSSLQNAAAKAMDEALGEAVFTHPHPMRALPRLLQQAGLEIRATLAHVYTEIGTGSFFTGFAETYAPLVQRAGLLTARQVEDWLLEQRRALEQHAFFAACNFCAYLTRRPTD